MSMCSLLAWVSRCSVDTSRDARDTGDVSGLLDSSSCSAFCSCEKVGADSIPAKPYPPNLQETTGCGQKLMPCGRGRFPYYTIVK